jgi:hypothetical protein
MTLTLLCAAAFRRSEKFTKINRVDVRVGSITAAPSSGRGDSYAPESCHCRRPPPRQLKAKRATPWVDPIDLIANTRCGEVRRSLIRRRRLRVPPRVCHKRQITAITYAIRTRLKKRATFCSNSPAWVDSASVHSAT